MGCGNSVEDQVLLAKLDRLEVQVKKEKQLKKLSEMEGRPITSLADYNGFDNRTEFKRRMKTAADDDRYDTYTDKGKKKKNKSKSEKKSRKSKKSKKSKKDKEDSKKKTRAVKKRKKRKKK